MINIRNNKGIALITALMFTLISLTIVMALFYVITQGIQVSAQNKRYRTALDASYGGSEIMVKDILPVVMQNYSSTSLVSNTVSAFSGVGLQFIVDQSCFQKKLTNETANWPAGCSSTPDPKKAPDFSFVLPSSTGNPFIVYSKIVDTIPGNSDTSGLQLEGAGVAESASLLTPQSIPYIYRMEVQGERQAGGTAQANIQILYAY